MRTPGKLLLVATPIGNLGDITPRAREALETAHLIAAEDTRRTGGLLQHLGLKGGKVVSYYKDTETARLPELLNALAEGQTVALVSDSGLPCVSDPGARLVAAAREGGFAVEVLPGPCAAALAVAGSGFEGPFLFHGFPPRKDGERATLFTRLADYPETLVFYESPNRIADTVASLLSTLGNRPAWLARELTKLHEEWLGPDLSTLSATLATRGEVKGECTLVVAGNTPDDEPDESLVSDAEIAARLSSGEGTRQLADWLAGETGVSRRDAYQRVLRLAGK